MNRSAARRAGACALWASALLITLPSSATDDPFEFVVHYSDGTVAVECREGCGLPFSLPAECPRDSCEVIVRDGSISVSTTSVGNAAGKFRVVTDQPDTVALEVSLRPMEDSMLASCSIGCGWQRETFPCTTNPCIATIDELGIRVGDVAETDRRAAYENWAADHAGQQWLSCLAEHLLQGKMQGGPLTFGVAQDEADAACVEHRAAWHAMLKERGDVDASEMEQTVETMLRQVWDGEGREVYQPPGTP